MVVHRISRQGAHLLWTVNLPLGEVAATFTRHTQRAKPTASLDLGLMKGHCAGFCAGAFLLLLARLFHHPASSLS
jgi:hypothetical protein